MDELVERLSTGQHPVEITIRPERTAQAVKAKIESGYIHIKFTNTQGGTELGVALDKQLTDLSGGSLENQEGRITLVGDLTLNYEKVRCIADIDLRTFSGTGRLEPCAA
jgi:hypothetical protein